MIDNFILGDNQFFGINHHCRKSGEKKAEQFGSVEKIIEIMKFAKRQGAGGVMLSSHEKTRDIIRAMLKDDELANDFNIYPNIPYLMKYVQKSTQGGMIGLLKFVLGRSGFRWDNIKRLSWGGLGLIRKDFRMVMTCALDFEMSMYHGAKVKAIFLHNGIVDLILGLGLYEIFIEFRDYIQNHYGAIAGFGTLNLTKLVQALGQIGLRNPLIMAPFNAMGFHMNPSQKVCEEVAMSNGITLLAMNVLASGALDPQTAFKYVSQFKKIQHVVIGTSSHAHIAESYGLAKKCLGI